MEFPDLGKHCSEPTCKQLDFLPITCDACKQDFCKDHFSYSGHKCPFAFKKIGRVDRASPEALEDALKHTCFRDVQVPVCPLCNAPIPVKRGDIPDVVVGEHMDRDCTFHPGKNRNKVFTHRCSKEGCRKKEMLQLACAQCHGNFCIQHRHPLDHNCQAGSSSVSRGRASASRAAEQKPSGVSWLAQRLRRTVK